MAVSDKVRSGLDYPFSDRPEAGGARRIADGVFWIRMQLPIPGLDFINLWLLEDGDGWTLVDTGFQSNKTKGWWEEIFAGAFGGKPLKRLICTHFHPDHMGLAGWLVERWNDIPLHMTFTEWSFGRMLWLDRQDSVPDDVVAFYRQFGWSDEQLTRYKQHGFNNFARYVSPIPRGVHRLLDGHEIMIGGRAWRVIVGRGHSPEHACLFCPSLKLLISGDQILPKITPHVGVYPGEPEADPLRLYIDSLDAFRPLPDDTLVLPSHNDPFVGLKVRLDQLAHHHDDRLERLIDAAGKPKSVVEFLPDLFRRKLEPGDIPLASAEALAHLHLLMNDGRMTREIGADGVYRFRRADGAANVA